MKIFQLWTVFSVSATLIACMAVSDDDAIQTNSLADQNDPNVDTNKFRAPNVVQTDSVDTVSCANGNWAACGVALGGFLFNFFTWSDNAVIPVKGYQCVLKIRARISHWHLVYDAKFICPFRSQEGLAKGYKGRKTAAELAVRDFFAKNPGLSFTGKVAPQPIDINEINDFGPDDPTDTILDIADIKDPSQDIDDTADTAGPVSFNENTQQLNIN